MRTPIRAFTASALTVGLLSLVLTCSAQADDWTDTQGKAFKAEPIEALGPFVVFSEKPTVGRCLPVQALPLTELARFSTAVKNRSARATDWAQATSPLTAELRGRLEKMEQKRLVPFPVEGRPEPAVVVVVFLNKKSGDTWKLLWGSVEPISKLAKLPPGLVECVAYGVNYDSYDWTNTLKDVGAPWSLVKLDDQSQVKTLDRFVPRGSYSAIAFNRDGVPLFGAVGPDEDGVKAFWQKVISVVVLLEPANPFSWRPLAHYRTAEKIAAHPTGHVEPELIGYAIRPGSLARQNIRTFDATLLVSAEGVVSEVTAVKAETAIPPKLYEAIVTTLKKAVLVPALENGKPVASEFIYRFRDESATPVASASK